MTYEEFLARIIKDGLAEVQEAYKDQPNKLKGCINGFKACEDCDPEELAEVLKRAQAQRSWAYTSNDHDKYWRARMQEAQIEFVCNCVSAMLMNEKKPVIINPTARGLMKAAEIING